ncbi:zinc phosphodiesterase ELAC protein 1-like isoform X2 [Zootermopsis nevadensis]|uniref:zinc phosphodiesterase ELAC protein 1-like isoform X2 n=1 Tax=Zootermopsis nevadensis TaxID=136037 RepID=UPI000B8EA7E5|nr:zinc phosphodiesterase ELAC protein 1-like isoform X2 [Zootermopsis nevadensis]
MKIICLGTASCYPTSNRSVSCTAVRFEDGTVWIFDCGEGAQIQLQKSPVRPSRITKIFITHLHGDHLFGLPGLMCTLANMVPDRNDFTLEIYGPQGLRKFIRDTLILSRSALTYNYVVHELIPIAEQYPEDWNTWPADNLATGSLHPQEKQGKDITATNDLTWNVFDGQNVCVKAGALMHSIPSFGYVIAEQDEPGKLDAEYLKQLGVPPGPLYSRIKNGEAITLPSGKALDPLKVLGPPKRGRKITILGDTSDSFRMVDLAQSSDIILHEATLENSMEEKAIDMGHSTPKMAAQYAEKVGARVLMLYHFSQRYKTVLVNDTVCSLVVDGRGFQYGRYLHIYIE